MVAVAAASLTCGKKGDPLPPRRSVPAPAEELTLRQIGDRLHLEWKAPQRNQDGTTEDVSLREAVVMRRVLDPPPRPPEDAAASAEAAAPAEPAEETVTATPAQGETETGAESEIQEPESEEPEEGEPPLRAATSGAPPFEEEAVVAAALVSTVPGEVREHEEAIDPSWIGKRVEYAVRYVNRKRRDGPLSTVAALEPVPSLDPPSELRAQPVEGGVELEWASPPDGDGVWFSVYRRVDENPRYPEAPLHAEPLTASVYQDRNVAYGASVCYMVVAVPAQEGSVSVESLPSEEVCVTPVDRFAPPPPRALVAIASPEGILLSWASVEAPDLEGYRVYRKEGPSDSFRLLSEVATTSFRDTSVVPGTTYLYAVTAIDDAPGVNESARSEEVEVGVALEPP